MLAELSGKTGATACMLTISQFSPQSNQELFDAVASCLQMSAVGDCSRGAHGPIGDWDVSAITDMHSLFYRATVFNADISRWDVSAVTSMTDMFDEASSFDIDISRWDVSAVDDMTDMFYRSSSFNQVLCVGLLGWQ